MSKERDYFAENLAMLVSSGMDVLGAVSALRAGARSGRFKRQLGHVADDIYEGHSLSSALQKKNMASAHTISLLRIGERSGRLAENLAVVAVQAEKDRQFRSKLRSAMMYPTFVLSLTVIVGVGIAWFILPRLSSVFASLDVKLPVITQWLIGAGGFLNSYGAVAIPILALAAVVFFYFIFRFQKTKFIGQTLLFNVPGIKRMLQEIEVARAGYLLGSLLEAGLPIVEAVRALAEASAFSMYRRLYMDLAERIDEGNSFTRSLTEMRDARLFPLQVQQMIAAGERSGRLSDALQKIGVQYEARSDTTTKNLAVILEPILLIIVWVGVMFVALAVILPIYSLIGGIR